MKERVGLIKENDAEGRMKAKVRKLVRPELLSALKTLASKAGDGRDEDVELLFGRNEYMKRRAYV